MVTDRIERDILIAAPVERVWAVVTEATHLGTWFGDAGATIDLRPGGALTLTWQKHGTSYGRVERVEPPRIFSFHWIRGKDADPTPANSTLVEFTLHRENDGTRLRVVESGFRTLDKPREKLLAEIESHSSGWTHELNELLDYVAGILA